MIKPQKIRSKVKEIKKLNWKVTKFTFEHLNPKEVYFEPGQYISLKVGEKDVRPYSICSDFRNPREFAILAEIAHEGVGANYLKILRVGSGVESIGPSGKLHLKEPLPQTMHFFATGTGITPFLAMFYRLEDIDFAGKIRVYFGVRNDESKFVEDELRGFEKRLKDFKHEFYLSQKNGRVTILLPHMTDKSSHYYVCGHPDMVAEVSSGLLKNGIPEESILFEKYTRTK